MKRFFTLLAIFALVSMHSYALIWITVDKTATPEDSALLRFPTIQKAVNMVVAAGLDEQVAIFVKNGTYNECVTIGHKNSTPTYKMSIIGESRDGVIMQSIYPVNVKQLLPLVSADSMWVDKNYSAPLYVNGSTAARIYVENITFKNQMSAPNLAANALYVRDVHNFAFKNCKFIAFTNVVETKKGRRSLIYNCEYEGNTAFLKNSPTAMNFKSTFKMMADNGHVAEPEDNIYGEINGLDTVIYGFMFRECTFTKGDTVHAGTCWLAYPSAHHSGAIFINNKMGDQIAPVGFKTNANPNTIATAYFGEYNSMNLDGSPANVSARGNGAVAMTATDVDTYANLRKVYQMRRIWPNDVGYTFPETTSPAFRPDSMVCAPAAPKNVVKNGSVLTWTASDGAIDYIVFRDGAMAGYSAGETTFTDAAAGTNYVVVACNEYGAMSLPSGSTEVDMTREDFYNLLFTPNHNASGVKDVSNANPFESIFVNAVFHTKIACDFMVYNLSGRCVKVVTNGYSVNLNGFAKGLYVIKSVDGSNNARVTKVVL